MNLDVPRTNTSKIQSDYLRGFIYILIAVFFWGASASLAKILITTKYDTLVISQTRTSFAFILLLLFFLVKEPSMLKVNVSDLWKLAVLGIVGVAITNYTYYFTMKESSVATAILVQYTAPIWIILFSVFIVKSENINALVIVSFLIALIGCFFVVTNGSLNDIMLKGYAAITGPLSAFTYAYQILGKKSLLRRYSVWTLLLYVFGFAAIFWLVINPPNRILEKHYSATDWEIFLLFAVVSILIPHTAFAMGLKILNASTAGVIGILEPVFAIVIAFFVLNETLSFIQLLGAMLVICAITLLRIQPIIKRKIRFINEHRT